ncbi:helix-turn-helix domain-containing GNAT family N-acetyltransferase [Actinocorallia populi]|uniref:helix-turn-helix domain-containing GNAT family N-acetyltransferase n=1 Tax=Actinocorallia populi TaxID=2079200 RepID=UPI000D090F84|nr:helix-turn-helix domain-containing GNAT family N-acetyltransferase [Actinocorallia populi]
MNNEIEVVRTFNRDYTRLLGVLDEGLLDSPYSLTEARLLFELSGGGDLATLGLRESLGLDPGYLSRLLARLEADGLVVRSRSGADLRRQLVRLTPRGREVFAGLDTRSAAQVEGLLEGLPADRRHRLVRAMDAVRRILAGAPAAPFDLRPLRPGDLGWVVWRHGVFYAEERGWDATYEALVARVAAGYGEHHDPARENAWIAEIDGEPVGSVFCVRADRPGDVAQLRLLLVEPQARGLGLGQRLVDECLAFARAAGYREMVLWTVAGLAASRHLYVKAGFELESEQAEERFGDAITAQWWRLRL